MARRVIGNSLVLISAKNRRVTLRNGWASDPCGRWLREDRALVRAHALKVTLECWVVREREARGKRTDRPERYARGRGVRSSEHR